MNAAPHTLQWLALPEPGAVRAAGRSLPAPRGLMAWWLAIALLTWVQLRHDGVLPLPDPAWRGVVALALSVTLVSSVAGSSALEGLLLLVCAWAVAGVGGSGALVPLASVCAALTVAQSRDGHGLRARQADWRRALLPCTLTLLGLFAWTPPVLAMPVSLDPASPAAAGVLLIGVISLCWIHARHCQGADGSPIAGPVCALAILAAGGNGLSTGDLEHTVATLLMLAMWLPLLLAAHLPAGPAVSWWSRRAAISVSACAMGCWAALTGLL